MNLKEMSNAELIGKASLKTKLLIRRNNKDSAEIITELITRLQATEQGVKSVPLQKCPVCDGTGNDPFDSTMKDGLCADCPTCNGERVVPQHIIKE